MQNNSLLEHSLIINLSDIDQKSFPGLNFDLLAKVASFFNSKLASRKAPYLFYINPGITELSKEVQAEPKAIFNCMTHIANIFPEVVRLRSVYESNWFMLLEEEDFETLEEEDRLYNPDNPLQYHVNPTIRDVFHFKLGK